MPKLLTVLTMMIGLVPVLWSSGAGVDVMKRIVAPMVGARHLVPVRVNDSTSILSSSAAR